VAGENGAGDVGGQLHGGSLPWLRGLGELIWVT
jgi:hypothetical protein